MIPRPKPTFLRIFHKEDPPKEEREDFIKCFKRGGLKGFEKDVSEMLVGVQIEQYFYTDPYTQDVIRWVYVGKCWWCRYRKHVVVDKPDGTYVRVKKNHYEFSRLMASLYEIENGIVVFDGLWDARKHEVSKPPVIVIGRDGRKGIILGYNEWEICVGWIDNTGKVGVAVPIRNPDELEFQFVEDFKSFKKIIELVKRKNVKKAL
jgi:hypothetical protein